MNGLLAIACGNGLQDGLNPCIFMACAVFIIHSLWLQRDPSGAFWPQIVFVSAYALGLAAFNFGPAEILVFQKNFIFAAKVIYFILGAVAFVLGILFFKDWVLLKRGLPVKKADEKTRTFTAKGITVFLVTAALALALSALATLWPINNYMMLLGNESLLKGHWTVMPVLTAYIFSSMWALWFVWAMMGIKDLQPSLLKIFDAAVFLTASSCMIFMFK